MAYKHRYGSTRIRNQKIDNLSIGWDYISTPKSKYPVFLFTPDMGDTRTHYHIALNRKQVKRLKKWFDDYLKDTKRPKRKT